MNIIPLVKIAKVPTGNPYIGEGGFVELGVNQNLINVADFFPFHCIDAVGMPQKKRIRSQILDGQVFVHYDDKNMVDEIEVFLPSPEKKGVWIDAMFLQDINLFQPTLVAVKTILDKSGIKTQLIDVGFEAPDLGVSFFSNDYDRDLNVRLDAVAISFTPRET